ncbi:MAG TPA: hypothetical protein VN915_06855 [Elusimicrobiota bacterium]|nr:hypothetical protein [Elusimicrobiota bacterium]
MMMADEFLQADAIAAAEVVAPWWTRTALLPELHEFIPQGILGPDCRCGYLDKDDLEAWNADGEYLWIHEQLWCEREDVDAEELPL